MVSFAFGMVFYFTDIPVYLAFVFGGIALATAPAPALSIVNEFIAVIAAKKGFELAKEIKRTRKISESSLKG